MWVLPNRFFFTNWFYNKFHPSKYIPDEQEKKRVFSPDASQKLIRDYIHYDSPYRGVLVYFGLGTGKTCASIMATDSFVHRHKKVVVILPSSLENNYRKELNKCSTTGSMLRKYWNYIELNLVKDLPLIDQIMKQYRLSKAFIKELDGKLWLPYLPVDFPADKIKKAQVHMSAMSEEDYKLAQHIYQTILDNRYTFIHYNGINNKHLDKLEVKDDYGEDAFDNAIIVIDEVHTFISRVVNGGKIARRLYNLLISKPNIRLVLLSGTPVINNPFELCYTLNLLRGPMEEYTTSALKNKFLPPLYDIITYLGPLYKHIDMLELDATNTHLKFTLLPNGFVRKENDSVELEKGPYYKDEKQLADKIMRLLKDKIPINARYKTSEYTAFPNKKELFNEYFLDTTDPDNPRVKQENMELFLRRIQGIVSYYRIADEEKFPKALPPIFKPVEMSGHQFQYYAEVRNKEIQQDDLQKKYRKKDTDLFKTNSSYRAYSRMACNFVFPEEIPRPFPKEIRARILRKEIDVSEEDEEEEEEDDKLNVQVAKLYEQEVKDTLAKLQQQADMYLQGDGLKNYSPKMATFLEDIEKHGQVKSLVYSQFRTVEGIRLLKMVLEQAGWIELDFKLSKTTNEWMIANAETVLDPKYDHKRFIVFGDKEKTDLLISLFNADLKQLTRTIQQQLKTFSLTENLHGKLVSLLMITQSGAEGLNLRNVRYVYILEPFWNQVRIDQVIGRAIRKGSHLELPEAERNVQVIMYLAKFTPKQIRSNKTLQFRDEGKTTDENVRELALRKDKIIQYFLTLLKMNAIDCIFHADKNKPKQFNYKCYTPAVNIDPKQISYLPNITEDKSTVLFGMQERLKTIKGRAVLYNGNKYVKLETDDKLYDYDAYMTANVLIPVLNL